MNDKKILSILKACSIAKSLIEGRMLIREASHVKLIQFSDLIKPLKEAENGIDYKLLYVKRKIKSMVSSLEGFDPLIHKQIDYISTADIKEGIVDISLADDDSWQLDLKTGSIKSAKEVPEDITEPLKVPQSGINT